MREYETVYILRPDMTEQEEAAINSRLAEVVTREKGHLLKQAIWGKKKLAYEIRHFNKGLYVSLKYVSEAPVVQELERNLKILEPVIRFGTFRVGEVENLQERIARQAKEDEEEAARLAQQREEAAEEAEEQAVDAAEESESTRQGEAAEPREEDSGQDAGDETEAEEE